MDMSSLPAYATGIAGFLFIAGAVFAPWLADVTDTRPADEAERALMVVLGICLCSLWAMWRWLV